MLQYTDDVPILANSKSEKMLAHNLQTRKLSLNTFIDGAKYQPLQDWRYTLHKTTYTYTTTRFLL